MATRWALVCGVLALLVSVAVDALAAFVWRGYNFSTDSASQLTALGAPTRAFAAPLLAARCLLLVALGIGVFHVAGSNSALRVTAGLLIAGGAIWFLSGFFPTRLGETPPLVSVQVIFGAAAVVVIPVAAILVGAIAFQGWFRIYSIGTLLLFVILTVVGLTMQAEPHVGIQERVLGYGFLVWDAVLAVVLLNGGSASAVLS